MLDMLMLHRVDAKTGKKRLNVELLLPLGGMITLGLTTLILGITFYSPNPPREDDPYELPTMEQFEQRRLEAMPKPPTPPPTPTTPLVTIDAGPLDAAPADASTAGGSPPERPSE